MKQGTAPFINCSTQGFRPFSSLVAKVDGISIDCQIKRSTFPNKSEKEAFGLSLWRRYIGENPNLAEVLRKASGLFDPFDNGSVAEALWQVRAELLSKIISETTEPTEETVTESQISDLNKESAMFPGLKLKEISVMVSSKKVANFNSIAFSYSVTAEAEPKTDFLAAIEHIKAQLLAKVELDHSNFSFSIPISKPFHSNSKSSLGLGHIN